MLAVLHKLEFDLDPENKMWKKGKIRDSFTIDKKVNHNNNK